MAKNDNLKDFVTDLADAIREKKGTTDLINPQDFADEIRSIEGGGSQWTFESNMIDKDGNGKNTVQHISVIEGVTEIASMAYQYMPIESISLPNSVITLNQRALMASNIKNITLPRNVQIIGTSCFENCSKLLNVRFEGSPTTIGYDAFWGCTAMIEVHFDNCISIPQLVNTTAFNKTTCAIIVPDALYDEWIVATNWATYADRIVKSSEYNG